MPIDSKLPEISLLRKRVETRFGRMLRVHSDFDALRDSIFLETKELISETTLERLWNYSTRGYENVSRHTLDVLSTYVGASEWEAFLETLKNEVGYESDYFDARTIISANLQPGKRIRIGWLPNRVCIIRYLGNDRFIAEETSNSKLQPGDTFRLLSLQLHSPLYIEDLEGADGSKKGARYGVGLRNGLTMLQIL